MSPEFNDHSAHWITEMVMHQSFETPTPPGGDSYMEQKGMLVENF